MRQFTLFDSVEADFRATSVEMAEERADELCAKRLEYGLRYKHIWRSGRCLMDWNDLLRAEREWLHAFEEADEDGKRLLGEEVEAEHEELMEQNRQARKRAVEREAEEERRKSRFMGSWSKIKWID